MTEKDVLAHLKLIEKNMMDMVKHLAAPPPKQECSDLMFAALLAEVSFLAKVVAEIYESKSRS